MQPFCINITRDSFPSISFLPEVYGDFFIYYYHCQYYLHFTYTYNIMDVFNWTKLGLYFQQYFSYAMLYDNSRNYSRTVGPILMNFGLELITYVPLVEIQGLNTALFRKIWMRSKALKAANECQFT